MYNALLQILQSSPLTRNSRITDLKIYGQSSFRVKMRAEIASGLSFQLWLNHNPQHIRYAYQLFGPSGSVLRWDNAPHHLVLQPNFPHHRHDEQGQPAPSTLQGDPTQDLPVVLTAIQQYLTATLSKS